MRLHGFALLSLGLLLCPAAARAQASDVPAAVHARNVCRLAAQVLTKGRPLDKQRWALEQIAQCTDESPVALVHLWQTAPADTQQVRAMIWASERVRDDRIYQQARATVGDDTRPDLVRLGAMIVLASYAHPASAYSLEDLIPSPGPIGRIRPRSSWLVDAVRMDGAVPLAASVSGEVLELLRMVMRTQQSNRVVSYAATTIVQSLEIIEAS